MSDFVELLGRLLDGGEPNAAKPGDAGQGHARPSDAGPGDAGPALAALDDAYASWRALLAASSEERLAAPIGEPAGRYGAATRRSFVLHILDELIHHGAEAALLRDLYAATHTGSSHLLPGTSTIVP